MKISLVSQAALDDDGSFQSRYESSAKRAGKMVLVEHRNQVLQWNILNKTWNSTDIETTNSCFDPINQYFAILPMETQDNIFEIYKDIRSILADSSMDKDTVDSESLIDAIRPRAVKLFAQINQTHFYNWVWQQLRPNIPANIKEKFDPATMPGSVERTYLLEDYRGLIPLAIIVRMACPFQLDFTYLTRSFISSEHKDLHVYGLIQGSWPEKSAAMQRLKVFVQHTVGNDVNHPAVVLMGIGSERFNEWVLAHVVNVKLPTVDVMGINSTQPVAPALFAAVRARVNVATSGQPKVTKKFAEGSSNDDNNQSFLEGFRSRMALTIGQEHTGSHYLIVEIDRIIKNDTSKYSLLQRLAPGIDYTLVIDALQSAHALMSTGISYEQLNLAAWLMHPYSQCRATGNLRKEEIVAMCGMAQAIFLHHGMIDFAILVTGSYKLSELNETTIIGEQISPIRAADRIELSKSFPIEQRGRGSRAQANTVIEDVTAYVRGLQNYDITCTFSQETLEAYCGAGANRRYDLRKDAAMMFMNFGKWLDGRELVEIDPMQVYEELMAKQLGQ